MKITKEDFDSLPQLDRIEFRQLLNSSSKSVFEAILIAYLLAILNFYFLATLVIILSFYLLINYGKLKEKLENKYFTKVKRNERGKDKK